jgi:hypothetical protein
MSIHTHDERLIEMVVEMRIDGSLFFQIEENHPSARERALIFSLMVVKASFFGVIFSSDIAHIVASFENARIARSIDMVLVNALVEEEERTSGHLICMK